MSRPPLLQIVYASSASRSFLPGELRELVERSRARNLAAGVTGMLLYHDGCFLQALEGPEKAVKATFERIRRDGRHRGLIRLLCVPIEEREFPDWSMGLVDLRDVPHEELDGLGGAVLRPVDLEDALLAAGRAHRLLSSFRSRAR